MKQGLIAGVIALMLAGCGGGGGSSSPVPPTSGGGGTTQSAVLHAGFAQTGNSKTTAGRRTFAIQPQASLGGSILPFAIFYVPDSYVPMALVPTISYTAVAYMTGNDIPSPPPSVTFTQSGDPLQFLAANDGTGVAGLPSGAVPIGGEAVGAPSALGQSFVTASAVGQSVTLTANTYAGTAIATASNGSGAPVGLTCTASGCQPTTSGTPDLTIREGSPSSFVAPNGIVEVNKSLDQVSSADFVNPETTLPVTDWCAGSSTYYSFVFKTASGVLVKLNDFGLYGSNLASGTCDWNGLFGIYLASNASGTFAY